MSDQPDTKSASPSNVERRKSLRPPQFGLRTMLLVITAIGVLLAFRHWFDPIVVVAVTFLALSVACHVAGNAIGTRLREIGNQPNQAADTLNLTGRIRPQPQDFAPTTQLGQRRSLGYTIVIATSMGIAAGAIGGGFWTFLTCRGQPEILTIAVGVAAFAVLGGLASFAIVGFMQVLLGAIWQAMKPPSPLRPPP